MRKYLADHANTCKEA